MCDQGEYYKVYRIWNYFVGHLRHESNLYKVYQGWTRLEGSVELVDMGHDFPLLLSGGAALLLLLKRAE
jgi:hypothetical protein